MKKSLPDNGKSSTDPGNASERTDSEVNITNPESVPPAILDHAWNSVMADSRFLPCMENLISREPQEL
jgi:hypothetical protein